jgi:hypothetical protein
MAKPFVPVPMVEGNEAAFRQAQPLIDDLQRLLQLSITTGQITLNLREGRLESWETRTFARLKRDTPGTDPTKT